MLFASSVGKETMGYKHHTEDEYIERINNIIKTENLSYEFCGFSGEFKGVKTKAKIKCEKHGVYEVELNSFFRGSRCAKCRTNYKLTKEQVEKRILDRISTENLPYSFVDFEEGYRSIASKVIVHCNACDYDWHTSANHFFGRKSYCPKCTGRRTYSIQERELQIMEIIKKENLNYDFYGLDFGSCSETVTSKARLKVYCKDHDLSWHPTVADFVNAKRRCPMCRVKSKSECEIALFLRENNIRYIHQYSFDGCKYKHRLPFDFYLPDENACIEYDGQQHFHPVAFGGNTKCAEAAFELQKRKDKIKTDFCTKNGIRLIRIKYCNCKELNDILRTELM